MIAKLQLKFGRTPSSVGENIELTPINVFVGPNNSGKSKTLMEIGNYCSLGNFNDNDVILQSLEFKEFDTDIARSMIDRITMNPRVNEPVHVGQIVVGGRGHRSIINKESVVNVISKPNNNRPFFCSNFLKFLTLVLNGSNRIQMVNSQNVGDLQRDPDSSFQVLFRNDEKRREVRRIIHESFGKYFVIDPTHIGFLRIRLSDVQPESDVVERGLHSEAVKFHEAAKLIDHYSDGVKAFTGIILEIIAGDPKVLIIDEPEAFLHPSLAVKLGTEVSRAAARSENKTIFVSTHSPSFIMGCIQSGVSLNIIRLTYTSGCATARLLKSSDILELMRNPLLRSTGVLSGLFFEFVVVTESDTDRAFYQEINERLLVYAPNSGIPNCLFINAQNKQTIKTIIKPLRELGIPTAGIFDIDVIKEGGNNWSEILACASIPITQKESFLSLRRSVYQKFLETGRDMKRECGLLLLDGESREASENLFRLLREYGIFVVPNGEIESWLKELGVSGHGPNWLIKIFEKMGENPDDVNYIKPSEGDVWKFMEYIKEWMINPNRKGIPA